MRKSSSKRPEVQVGSLIGRSSFRLTSPDIIQLDERKRLALGKVAAQGDGYRVYVNEDGQILLDPVIAIPVREAWLYKNPEALARVQAGLADLAAGCFVEGPDLSLFVRDDA